MSKSESESIDDKQLHSSPSCVWRRLLSLGASTASLMPWKPRSPFCYSLSVSNILSLLFLLSIIYLWLYWSGAHSATLLFCFVSSIAMDANVLDDIISRLLEVRKARPGTLVQLAESEIHLLCVVARGIFLAQPNLLELEAPIKICGQLPLPFRFSLQLCILNWAATCCFFHEFT